MKLRHTAAWVGFTAAALVATSACSAESVKQTADAVDKTDAIMAALSRATDRSEELGSAEVKVSTDLGTGTPIAMNGTYSWGDGMAYDVQMDTAAAQMQTVQDDPTIQTLFVDGVYYYDVDPQASGPLKGKEWMKVDASAVFGEAGAKAMSGGNANPIASLKTIKYAKNVKDLGSETVDGQKATHYRAVVGKSDMGKLKDAYTDEDSLLNQATGGAYKFTFDIWVNDKDLPVRLEQEMGGLKVTMDFAKFGATAEVKAPPAAQTADMSEALKEAQGQ
ncbi:lipoprotein [Streptomyces sp. WM6386]|uniref:lipoprotein n=1 Tax=Streptomyces sp. WM6386 TaxID=1415558 RepID=UPI000619D1B7|nr:lipoprotein [Streptomyces sp. WM6386]KKD03804.1 lipoprotein [Streptomyces sp. WM6386]